MREPLRPGTLPNAKSPWATTAEEHDDRQAAAEAHLAVLRTQLPDLLSRFARIRDPRRLGSVRHRLTVLMVYGVLLFAFGLASRREANRELSRPALWETLREVFPELDSIPHADTLERLLDRLEPEKDIESALATRMRALVRRQKLRVLMVERGYVVAIDGEQLFARDHAFAVQATHRREGEQVHYAVYVVKALLVCPEGVRLPLGAEFCENVQVDKDGKINEEHKQDCEFRASQRLCARLREYFPHLPILLVADGLYAAMPVVAMCRRYRWDFMIVLKEGKMPSLWREVEELHRLDGEENTRRQTWHGRTQGFWWVNGVEHEVRVGSERRRYKLNAVVCEERWHETRADGTEEEKTARHAWLSGRPLSERNVHRRCNLAGRHRWDLEEEISLEKHVEHMRHAFSLNWTAIKAWYYLMLLGTLINTLALYTTHLFVWVTRLGVRATTRFVWETYTVQGMDPDRLKRALARPAQLRLIF